MSIQILASEGMAFRRAADALAVLEPRNRTQGPFLGKHVGVAGRSTIDLSGLDYLALGSASETRGVIAEALRTHDCGIPGSGAIIKTGQAEELSEALTRFHLGADADGGAIISSTGYAANFSLMEALGLRRHSHFLTMHGDAIPAWSTAEAPTLFFIDGDAHFSIRHGIRFARKLGPEVCDARVFRSGDAEHLEALLRDSFERHGERAVRVIVTDTVESATGRELDMASLCELAAAYDCLLYADEAHAVGAMGPHGRGITAAVDGFERYRDRLVLMGTLTKVFCQPGGYAVLGDGDLAAMLRFCSPQQVFSAPIAPWNAAATTALLELVGGPFGDRRRARLHAVAMRTRELLAERDFELIGDPRSGSPIVAIPLHAPSTGVALLELMQRAGFIVSVFQGPLMPAGREVVRISMRCDLTDDEIARLVAALEEARRRLRFSRPTSGVAAA